MLPLALRSLVTTNQSHGVGFSSRWQPVRLCYVRSEHLMAHRSWLQRWGRLLAHRPTYSCSCTISQQDCLFVKHNFNRKKKIEHRMSWFNFKERIKSSRMSAAGEDGGSNERSGCSETILLKCAIYVYHCKSHIRELAVCSVAGAVADVALICRPALPTVSSKSAMFMLAPCSLSRTTLKHSRRPFWSLPESRVIRR